MNSDSSEGVREYSDVFNAGLQKVGKEWILEGNGLSILEETEPELEGFTHNDSEIDDFEFG